LQQNKNELRLLNEFVRDPSSVNYLSVLPGSVILSPLVKNAPTLLVWSL